MSAKLLSYLAPLLWLPVSLLPLPVEARLQRYLIGNPGNVNAALTGPVYLLGGGGPDVDAAIQELINRVRGCNSCNRKLDVVIIRASGDDGYNRPIYRMRGVDSVETLVINSREAANRPGVASTVRNAEVIFFAGGDQCQYVTLFQNTALESAASQVVSRGGGMGGTSAGAMIQSEFVYNACAASVDSREALRNPYGKIGFTVDFFSWSPFASTVVDTHFDSRDRMGRLMAFLSRQIADGRATTALGIGVSEATSVLVDQAGTARVMGRGPVYFVLADQPPQVCRPGVPLTHRDYKIWKVARGKSFNLKSLPTSGYYLRSVNRGRLNANPY